MKPKTYKHDSPRQRTTRLSKITNAQDAIGDLAPGCEIFILTYGQFSLIDALSAILKQTGPAHVTLTTWTAANADLRTSAALMQSAAITSFRFIVDRSFLTRQPQYCRTMRDLFGDDCIRTARSHAKWALVSTETRKLVIRTSMNLNHNARLENIEISDDPKLFGFMNAIADELFAEQQPGHFAAELPLLDSIESVKPSSPLNMGSISSENLKPPSTTRT